MNDAEERRLCWEGDEGDGLHDVKELCELRLRVRRAVGRPGGRT